MRGELAVLKSEEKEQCRILAVLPLGLDLEIYAFLHLKVQRSWREESHKNKGGKIYIPKSEKRGHIEKWQSLDSKA